MTADPHSQTIAIGSDATFTAAASGLPAPTVGWQVDTGSGWVDVPGATATTLTLTAVTHGMNGNRYRARFTNGIAPDATTAVAALTVPAPPIVDVPPDLPPASSGPTPALPVPVSGPADIPPAGPSATSEPAKPKVSHARVVRGVSTRVTVQVAGPGEIRTSGSGVRRASKTVTRAGTYRMPVTLSPRGRRTLLRKGHVRVRVTVRFTSVQGTQASVRVRVTFKRRTHRR